MIVGIDDGWMGLIIGSLSYEELDILEDGTGRLGRTFFFSFWIF
jgi:hypothetical protein